MKKYQFLLLIILIMGISSCKKDSDEELIEYPITYTSYGIANSNIRVFLKNQELTSTLKEQVINRQINYLPSLEEMEIEGKFVATYISADTVELKFNFSTEKEIRIVTEESDLIYWERQDITEFTNSSFFHFGDFFKYLPLYYEEFDVPWATGYSKKVKGKECYYVVRDKKKLMLPMLDYIYKNEIGAVIKKEINNRFNENSISDLNDTLLIREYVIELE
jgi:hypothetical protein